MYFISLSASKSIYTVFNICNPATAPLFVLPQCVILGIKIECPIYLGYHIAKYFWRDAFHYYGLYYIPYVCHGNRVIARCHVFFYFALKKHYVMPAQRISQLASKRDSNSTAHSA